MSKHSNPLRDKLDEDTLDLSLMNLDQAPVQDMAMLTKGTTVDLSNNRLTDLPDNFVTLTHIVKLDLSKNHIAELPEFFGHLKSLRHLDLYSNELNHLPVSFAQLEDLKWLDLKNNPLVPTLSQAAGPCITATDCQMCAKKVVALLQSMQSQLERERQRRILEEAKAQEARKAQEEREREKVRADKRAAKERRREEARAKMEMEQLNRRNGGNNNQRNGSSSINDYDMERPRENGTNANSSGSGGSGSGRSCFWSLLMFLAGLGLICLASGIALIWIYTGGKLDEKNVQKALPIIRRDFDASVAVAGRKAEVWMKDAGLDGAWEELVRRNDMVASSVREGWSSTQKQLSSAWATTSERLAHWWRVWALPRLWQLWAWLKPYFQLLGEFILRSCSALANWLGSNGPIWWASATQWMEEAAKSIQAWING